MGKSLASFQLVFVEKKKRKTLSECSIKDYMKNKTADFGREKKRIEKSFRLFRSSSIEKSRLLLFSPNLWTHLSLSLLFFPLVPSELNECGFPSWLTSHHSWTNLDKSLRFQMLKGSSRRFHLIREARERTDEEEEDEHRGELESSGSSRRKDTKKRREKKRRRNKKMGEQQQQQQRPRTAAAAAAEMRCHQVQELDEEEEDENRGTGPKQKWTRVIANHKQDW